VEQDMQRQTSDPKFASLEAVARSDAHVLLALARRLAGDRHEAADLVQEAFERAIRSPRSLSRNEMKPWMATVIRNLFLDRCRARRVRARLLQAVRQGQNDTSPESEEERAWARFTAEDVNKALEHLDPAFREVFELHARSVPLRTVAEVLAIPLSTAGTRLFRARRKLRALLLASTQSDVTSPSFAEGNPG
jgi:RNA polymerase sigma-70 factor (ECF subfamily)